MSVSDRRRDGKSGGGGRLRIDFEERESHRKVDRVSLHLLVRALVSSLRNFYQDKESNGGRDKKREWNQDKERDQSLKTERELARGKERHSDLHRDYHRGGSTNNERVKSNLDDREYYRGRDTDRQKYRHEKDRRYKHRSRSHSKDKFNKRAKPPSPSKSKRTSGFDMAPPGLPDASASGNIGSLPVVPQLVSGTLPMLPITAPQFGSVGLMPAQAVTQQATRHARRVYVGGLPPMANEQTIATFFSHVMSAIGGNSAGPGDAVVNVYINHEKKFAFVEMRSVEEASNAMALDGIIFEGVSVKVRRPTDYNPSLAATLGPGLPSPHLNLAVVGLSSSSTIMGSEGPDRIFVGGLPYYLADAQIRELLESFGPLCGLDLVKDRDTGNSKGYGFCVYQDPSVTDIACAALNGLKMGDKTLTVRRASARNSKAYRDALQATDPIESPAVGFAKPSDYQTGSYSILLKQNNTQIQLLAQIAESLREIQEELKAIREQQKGGTSSVTPLPDSLIEKLQKLSLGSPEKPKEGRGKLRIKYENIEEIKEGCIMLSKLLEELAEG
ncbi:uncharacterized protein LOC141847523 [Curcuma longa]|uniref:uncharacterized protein LOC141847523 n=1 Tax=Curcuma longa TaxID=136217 RepID=UPI003D9E76AC